MQLAWGTVTITANGILADRCGNLLSLQPNIPQGMFDFFFTFVFLRSFCFVLTGLPRRAFSDLRPPSTDNSFCSKFESKICLVFVASSFCGFIIFDNNRANNLDQNVVSFL